jgi:DNA repair protein RecO (recombination protein O)
LQDGAAEEDLFEWCKRSILTLDALDGDFQNYHLRWLMELISVLGFSPALEDIAPFAGENLREIKDLLSAPMPEFMVYPLNGKKRSAIADSLLRYLSAHLEIPLNIRSLAVLGELYR